jgi:excisionase family DNA binding protein
MQHESWVSLEEVAKHLGVSKDSVHAPSSDYGGTSRWIRRRKMPAHKVGHLWKFKVSEVDAWVREGKTQTRHH